VFARVEFVELAKKEDESWKGVETEVVFNFYQLRLVKFYFKFLNSNKKFPESS
jgi:hypothetical protein